MFSGKKGKGWMKRGLLTSPGQPADRFLYNDFIGANLYLSTGHDERKSYQQNGGKPESKVIRREVPSSNP